MSGPEVLLVGDDEELQRQVAGMLAEDGLACLCSRSLLEAQRLLERGGVAVLISDADLGDLAGLELPRSLPTIALVKPVDLARLRQLVARAVPTARPAAREPLDRLDRAVRELGSELLALYSSARARGSPLDLGTVQAAAGTAAARLFGGRRTVLLRYNADEKVLRGAQVDILVDSGDMLRFLEVDEGGALADRIGHALGGTDVFATVFGHNTESCGLLALVGTDREPLTALEGELWRRFAEHLKLSFAGAQLFKEVLDLSSIDGLTGLYNHRFFHERLRDELARALRYTHPVSLLFCDIDDFKRYNDENGHAAGDAALARLGQIFRNAAGGLVAFRESDIRARYGGEEFAVLLPETPAVGAVATAERLREAVAETSFPSSEDPARGRLTISIGVCEFPRDAEDREHLVEVADRAMYRAKHLGKNRVVSTI